MTLELRDASVWQGSVDWRAAARSGIAGGLAKASEGVGYEDPWWRANQAGLLASGLVGGSYHFGRPDLGNSPAEDADWYLGRHDPECFSPSRPWIFALDAESGGGSAAWCYAFLDHVATRTGYACWFYSFSAWITGRRVQAFANPLWLAWPDSNGPLPTMGWQVVTMQQYGTVPTPGIPGNVDANRFFGDLATLRSLAGGGGDDMTSDEHAMLTQIRYAVAPTGSDPNAVPVGSSGDGELAMRLRGIDNVLLPGLDAKLDALLSAQGAERAAIDALAANAAAGTALAALKAELDSVLQGAAGPIDLSRVYAQLAALGKHLGVDVTSGPDS